MTNDEKRKVDIITNFFALYGQAGDGERIAAYVRMFRDIPEEFLQMVCDQQALRSKFLPSVAELVEGMRSLIGTIDKTRRVKPWNEAQEEIRRGITRTWYHGCLGENVPAELYGKSCDPKWSTPEIKAAVDSYGFDNLGKVLESDMPIVWAQLRKAYEAACEGKQELTANRYALGKDANRFAAMVDTISRNMKMIETSRAKNV